MVAVRTKQAESLPPKTPSLQLGLYLQRRPAPMDGALAQYLVADARQMLRVSPNWTDIQAAALGGVR